ncbi:MAG TPA: VTT domain-containing protein [bacterium]|nr:VTT domain-containing protein [bacterium]
MEQSSSASSTPRPHTAGQKVAIVLSIAALAAVVVLLVLAGGRVWHFFRHPSELRPLVRGWGAWAPLGILAFQVTQIVIAPLPGDALSFTCGYVLGFWPTIVWLMVGVMLGSTADFLLTRLLGRRVMRFFLSPEQLARLDSAVLRRGTFYVLLLLLVPNPVGDWVYYLAGLTSMPWPIFILLVFVGKLPSNLLNCSLGATATHFGWREWAILGLVAATLAFFYYKNRARIQAALDRVSSRHRVSAGS